MSFDAEICATKVEFGLPYTDSASRPKKLSNFNYRRSTHFTGKTIAKTINGRNFSHQGATQPQK